MAVAACPQCKKKMSSHAVFCSRCGYAEAELTEEQRDRLEARMLRDSQYRLRMLGYAVIAVFLGAVGWLWWDTGGFQSRPTQGPFWMMGAAALAYLWVRYGMIRVARKKKALKKKRSRWS